MTVKHQLHHNPAAMADSTTDGKAGQVRIQLSTRHADVELPPDTGTLLVSSSKQRGRKTYKCAD
ncbi:MAG: hypothetical protein INR71_11080 [Terriglobus roseus]|nr:hypothetical protein [Terriglobus roseus]